MKYVLAILVGGVAVGVLLWARPAIPALPALPAAPTPYAAVRGPRVEDIQAMGLLVTARYRVSVRSEAHQGAVLWLVNGEDVVLPHATADVYAGVDFARITGEGRTLYLPPAEITQVVPDEASFSQEERSLSGLQVLRTDLSVYHQARVQALSAIRATACEQGILGKANTEAARQLRGFLQARGVSAMIVLAKAGEC